MTNSHSNLQTILFLLCTVALSLSASIDLLEPSLITWDDGKSNFTLIAYHFQNIGTQQWKKLNEHFANYQEKDGTFSFNDSYSYTYKPVELIHEASMNFFFKISNRSIQQGVLTGKSYYSNNTSIMLAKDSTLFQIQPKTPTKKQFQQFIIYQMDGERNIYYIPKQLYSETPACNKYLSSVNQQILLKSLNDPECQVYSGQRIIKQTSYKKIRLLNGPLNTSELFLTTDFDLGIQLKIDSSIKVVNLKVYPLSKIQFDLSQVTINVVNYKANGAQKIKVNIQNKGEEFVFIKVSCMQAGQSLLSRTILVGAKLSQIIEAALSQISPSSEIIFKITNPVTSEFYLFSTPSSLVQDLSTSTFYFQGSQFTESIGGLSKPAVIGIAVSVGISIFIVLIGVFIYRRKKKVQKMVSLNLERLRNTCNTVVSTSQRQFVNKQIPPIGLMIEDEIPVRKSKQQTSTTIASSTRESIKQETEQKLSQKAASIEEYMQKRDQQMPKIEDKPYLNKQIEDQFITEPPKKVKKPKIYKPGHRRTSSAVQILPAEPDIQSHEQICSSVKRSIQVLQNVQV